MVKKKYIFLIMISIILVLFCLSSCSRIQEKPDITQDLISEKVSGSQEMTTGSSESSESAEGISVTESKETIESARVNLGILQEAENNFAIINAFPDISFERPLDFQNAGDGTGRIFIVEQGGKIFIINNNKVELFLDISDRVYDGGNERGLLGLAFHPDFKNNGRFFINYTTRTSTVISRFATNRGNPNTADPESEEIIITFEQPYANHNGGKLAFSPEDSYLYIATGDGGGAGDPQKNGQNLKTLLGKILRIDVDSNDPGLSYSIPSDNPYKDNKEDYRGEIYAYGLRNPWRFSFDSATGKLWTADVGQDKMEEINIIEKGKNYGWNIMEGSYCYEPPSGCNPEGLELPIYEYQHPLGKSVTGGYVYHGKALPLLQGVYIYADFVTGYIWGLAYGEGQEVRNFTFVRTDLNISSFGIDENQELYFTAFDGKIYQLTLP